MTGAILAGGQSRRMGSNKALLKIGGETIIERTVRVFKKIFDDTVIIANDPLTYEGLSTRIYTDIHKGAGALGGVYTALFHSSSRYTFVAACDMPLLDEASIKVIVARAGLDAVVPYIDGRLHPMHALYSKRCMRTIEEMIKAGDLKINNLLERLAVRKLTVEDFKGAPIGTSVENINTPYDLSRITHGN